MTAEERLAQSQPAAVEVGNECAVRITGVVEGFARGVDLYGIAREAIAHVRALVEGWQHDETCESLRDGSRCCCNGVVAKADRWLDGEER